MFPLSDQLCLSGWLVFGHFGHGFSTLLPREVLRRDVYARNRKGESTSVLNGMSALSPLEVETLSRNVLRQVLCRLGAAVGQPFHPSRKFITYRLDMRC